MTRRDTIEFTLIAAQGSVELPDRITDMKVIDDRVLVFLADGRRVDMTDWFTSEGAAN